MRLKNIADINDLTLASLLCLIVQKNSDPFF